MCRASRERFNLGCNAALAFIMPGTVWAVCRSSCLSEVGCAIPTCAGSVAERAECHDERGYPVVVLGSGGVPQRSQVRSTCADATL